jgi:Protein of unknown function (DUF1194)
MVQTLRIRGLAASLALAAALGPTFLTPAAANSLPLGGQTATIAPLEVDVELVLAVDVSFSMDMEEQRVQRQGYVDALRSDDFIMAVRNGMLGKVAISYLEWGGIGSQTLTMPWQVIETREDAEAFAAALEAKEILRLPRTSISGAIDASLDLLRGNAIKGMREVIDVSGDGPNNAGAPVADARERAAALGVTINGLPLLMNRDDDGFDYGELDIYYKRCIITGPGSFVIPVRGKEEFRDAIRTKIIREIAFNQLTEPVISLASDVEEPQVDCLAGEKMLRIGMPPRVNLPR